MIPYSATTQDYLRNSAIFLVGSACIFLVIVYSWKEPDFEGTVYNVYSGARPLLTTIQTTKGPELLLDYCVLPQLDPWAPELALYFDPSFNPLKSCKVDFKKLTDVVNNSIILHSDLKHQSCNYRCLMREDDVKNAYGNWTLLVNGTKPECDIVHVECSDANQTIIYENLHALIYRDEKMLTPPESSSMPSVHIIVLDSVSSSQFERSMVKTASYLRNRLRSQRMKYLNKIGLNSRPNAYGLFLGKTSEPIPASSISVGYPMDWPEEPCYKFLDDEPFIGFRYQDAGYVTFIAEDWDSGTFNWPDCVGFKNGFMHHYMRPYQNFYYSETKYIDILHTKQCREHVQDVLDYYQKFLDTYADRPSFSINWFTAVGHDNFNELYHVDDYFYDFFRRNEKYWENSYVIVMADHGNRAHPGRGTKVAEVEDNNPMLWISVPKDRRTYDVLNQLEDNSNKLITPYDIYATLVNLVHPKNPTHPNLTIYGEDLFGPLREPRTCDRLRIPIQYCICNFSKNVLPANNLTAIVIAKESVKRINQELDDHPETNSSCARLSLDLKKAVTAESFLTKGNGLMLRVFWSTKPGTGEFSAVAVEGKNGTIKIVSTRFPRSSRYEKEAECVEHSLLRAYCFCLQ